MNGSTATANLRKRRTLFLRQLRSSYRILCVKLHLRDGRTDRQTVRPSVHLLDGVWHLRMNVILTYFCNGQRRYGSGGTDTRRWKPHTSVRAPRVLGWNYGAFMCKATPFLQGTAVSASVNTLMAIAFDRYSTTLTLANVTAQNCLPQRRLTNRGKGIEKKKNRWHSGGGNIFVDIGEKTVAWRGWRHGAKTSYSFSRVFAGL